MYQIFTLTFRQTLTIDVAISNDDAILGLDTHVGHHRVHHLDIANSNHLTVDGSVILAIHGNHGRRAETQRGRVGVIIFDDVSIHLETCRIFQNFSSIEPGLGQWVVTSGVLFRLTIRIIRSRLCLVSSCLLFLLYYHEKIVLVVVVIASTASASLQFAFGCVVVDDDGADVRNDVTNREVEKDSLN